MNKIPISEKPRDIRERSFEYALGTIKLYQFLPTAIITTIIVNSKNNPNNS
jgi:hypothetical protein